NSACSPGKRARPSPSVRVSGGSGWAAVAWLRAARLGLRVRAERERFGIVVPPSGLGKQNYQAGLAKRRTLPLYVHCRTASRSAVREFTVKPVQSPATTVQWRISDGRILPYNDTLESIMSTVAVQRRDVAKKKPSEQAGAGQSPPPTRDRI